MKTEGAARVAAALSGADYERGLDALLVAPAAEVDRALFDAVTEASTRLFGRGWQPVELHRAVGRRIPRSHGSVAHADMVADAVAVHLRGIGPGLVDPRWQEQVDALRATVWWPSDEQWVAGLARRWRVDRIEVLDAALALLRVLRTLPRIEVLVPEPGRPAAAAAAAPAPKHMLDRVRALLAKAESTNYPAEADTYTAKAQELIARHRIDEALLHARGVPDVVPFARRIGVDHPYEHEKAALLDAIATANRCYVVWTPELGFATVFGFDADIDAVDLLHASLLVQANRAMSLAERGGGKTRRGAQKAFRQSFLVAFTVRIGERLAAAAEETVTAAVRAVAEEGGPDLLPVLASRDAQVRDSMHKVFPRTVRGRGSRVDSDEGWEEGRAAADRAELR